MKTLFTLLSVSLFNFSFLIFNCSSAFSQTISAGGWHSLFVCTDATARTCGYGAHGQLGDGTTIDKSTPVQVSGLTGITAVAGAYKSSLFLKNNGTVWACGFNANGQLGDGTTIDKSTPVQVSPAWGGSITAVAAGRDHSLFLKNDGSVWACGWNIYGQLGDGTGINQSIPVQTSPAWGGSITAVSGGGTHSLFLKNNGTVWACGLNDSGELGDGTTTQRLTPVQVSGLTGITAVAAGWNHSLFLKNDGTVWACGYNLYGQLGVGTTINKSTPVQVSGLNGITAVAAGFWYSLFLKNDGTVWACGHNAQGQLGDGTTISKSTPMQVSGLTGITAVAAGAYYSLFLKNNGTAWACGSNNYGQFGDGTTISKLTPVQLTNLCTVPTSSGALQPLDLETIHLYPNPASDEITAEIAVQQNTKATIEVFNTKGEQVLYKEAGLTKGLMQVKINVSQLAAGNYMFRITLPNKQKTEKIFIR